MRAATATARQRWQRRGGCGGDEAVRGRDRRQVQGARQEAASASVQHRCRRGGARLGSTSAAAVTAPGRARRAAGAGFGRGGRTARWPHRHGDRAGPDGAAPESTGGSRRMTQGTNPPAFGAWDSQFFTAPNRVPSRSKPRRASGVRGDSGKPLLNSSKTGRASKQPMSSRVSRARCVANQTGAGAVLGVPSAFSRRRFVSSGSWPRRACRIAGSARTPSLASSPSARWRAAKASLPRSSIHDWSRRCSVRGERQRARGACVAKTNRADARHRLWRQRVALRIGQRRGLQRRDAGGGTNEHWKQDRPHE